MISVIKAGHPTNESVTLWAVMCSHWAMLCQPITQHSINFGNFSKRQETTNVLNLYFTFTDNIESHWRWWWLVSANSLWPSVNSRCDIQTFVIRTLQRFSGWMRDAVTKQIFDNWSFVKLPKNSDPPALSYLLLLLISLNNTLCHENWKLCVSTHLICDLLLQYKRYSNLLFWNWHLNKKIDIQI